MPNKPGSNHANTPKTEHASSRQTSTPAFTWTDRNKKDWQVTFEITNPGGRRQPIGFKITAAPDNQTQLTSEILRSFPFTRVFTLYLAKNSSAQTRTDVSIKQKGPRRGTPLDNSTLELVAQIYRQALNTGLSPTKLIAEQMNISTSTAAKRIQKAREQFFLKPALPGKPGETESHHV
jgi:hypothetical protein